MEFICAINHSFKSTVDWSTVKTNRNKTAFTLEELVV